MASPPSSSSRAMIFLPRAPALLAEIQDGLLAEAAPGAMPISPAMITSMAALADFFGEDRRNPGWAEVQWSKPTGAALDGVVEQLKALKLTFRNVPLGAAPADGACLFTGEPAVERIFVARAY